MNSAPAQSQASAHSHTVRITIPAGNPGNSRARRSATPEISRFMRPPKTDMILS